MARKYEKLSSLELDGLLKINLNIKLSVKEGISERDAFNDYVLNKIKNYNLQEEFISNLFFFLNPSRKNDKNYYFDLLVCDISFLKMAALKTIDENKEILG